MACLSTAVTNVSLRVYSTLAVDGNLQASTFVEIPVLLFVVLLVGLGLAGTVLAWRLPANATRVRWLRTIGPSP